MPEIVFTGDLSRPHSFTPWEGRIEARLDGMLIAEVESGGDPVRVFVHGDGVRTWPRPLGPFWMSSPEKARAWIADTLPVADRRQLTRAFLEGAAKGYGLPGLRAPNFGVVRVFSASCIHLMLRHDDFVVVSTVDNVGAAQELMQDHAMLWRLNQGRDDQDAALERALQEFMDSMEEAVRREEEAWVTDPVAALRTLAEDLEHMIERGDRITIGLRHSISPLDMTPDCARLVALRLRAAIDASVPSEAASGVLAQRLAAETVRANALQDKLDRVLGVLAEP